MILYLFTREEMIHRVYDQGKFLLKFMGYAYYWVTSWIISITSSIHALPGPTATILPPACLNKDDHLPGILCLPVVLWEPKLGFLYTKQTWSPTVNSQYIIRIYSLREPSKHPRLAWKILHWPLLRFLFFTAQSNNKTFPPPPALIFHLSLLWKIPLSSIP